MFFFIMIHRNDPVDVSQLEIFFLSSGTFPNFKLSATSKVLHFFSAQWLSVCPSTRLSVGRDDTQQDADGDARVRPSPQTRKQRELVQNPNRSVAEVRRCNQVNVAQRRKQQTIGSSLKASGPNEAVAFERTLQEKAKSKKKKKEEKILCSCASISQPIYNRVHLHNKCGKFSCNLRVIYIAFHELCNATPPVRRSGSKLCISPSNSVPRSADGRRRSEVNGGLRPLLIKENAFPPQNEWRGNHQTAERRRYRHAAEPPEPSAESEESDKACSSFSFKKGRSSD